MSAALVVAACGTTEPPGDPGIASVVATTSILADVVRNVTGDEATVDVILPVGVDPHEARPSARQVAAMEEATLVVANGLGLEEGMLDVLASIAERRGTVVEVGALVDPIPLVTGDGSALDPHVWMDPVRMADAAVIIGERLATVDPTGAWSERAAAYAERLLAVDAEIRDILAVIPPERRKLVTNHDALGYFAARYDLEIVGVIIPGGSTLAEPSSAEVAALVDTIRRNGVPAVFAETTEPAALAEALAEEAGEDVAVVELFTGSLGPPGSGAETLIDMLVTDARRIAAALA